MRPDRRSLAQLTSLVVALAATSGCADLLGIGGETLAETNDAGGPSSDANANSDVDPANSDSAGLAIGRTSEVSPGLAALGDRLHMVYVTNDGTSALLHTSSLDGVAWDRDTRLDVGASIGAPSVAALNGQLHVVYLSDGRHTLMHTSMTDGVHWTAGSSIAGLRSVTPPCLAAFGGRLHLLYVSYSDQLIHDLSSADGVQWDNDTSLPYSTAASPGMAEFNGRLHVIYLHSGDNVLSHFSSIDGVSWSGEESLAQSQAGPSLAPLGQELHVVYMAGPPSIRLNHLSMSAQNTWSSEENIGTSGTAAAPRAAAFKGNVHVAYVERTNHTIMHAHSADGIAWSETD